MVMRFLKKFYTFIIFLFLYAPILVLMVLSFNETKSRSVWGGFTLKWYFELFSNRDVKNALYYTLIIAFISAIVSTVVGTFAAIGIYNLGYISRKLILNINNMPVMNSEIVTGVALMTLFVAIKIPLGFFTLLISHIMFCTPYVILSVLPKLRQMNKHLPEAALDLGATPAYTIRKVIIPQIMPGIITGGLIAFTLSIDDFVISFFNSGSGVTNLSVVAYAMARRGINPSINALCTIMFLAVVILLIIINKRSSKGAELMP